MRFCAVALGWLPMVPCAVAQDAPQPERKAPPAAAIQGLGLGLNEKAIEAVRRWRFQPLIADGKPIKSDQSVEVRFLLNPADSSRNMPKARVRP
jgi:hypothetical protein